MIITVDEVKEYLQIKDSLNDALIGLCIPIAQGKILRYTNNYFLTGVSNVSSGISFSDNDIQDISLGFGEFVEGDIKVNNSKLNNGIYTVTSVDPGKLTISGNLKKESSVNGVIITQMIFPEEIKYNTSILIKWMLSKEGKLVNSESLPGYSATFKSEKEIMRMFDSWKKA